MLNLSPSELIQAIIIIVISLTVHEFGHSLMAIRLGDDTPRRQGRLTLNPLAHIDFIGFVMLLVAGFGWAKPVNIDPRALKKHQRDEILISLAGPLANVLLAVAAALIVWAFVAARASISRTLLVGIFNVLTQAAAINVGLALFNMLPIPPLDGSHLVTTWLTRVNMPLAVTYFRYGSWALLALIVIERVTGMDILPIGRLTMAIVTWFYRLLGIM
ncbi:MAG: site-2 protease family protein [Spirochaetia bacterium]|jgi:Zn-dependent protease